MASSGVDTKRRRFLIAATSVVGAVGVAPLAWAFIGSMNPSARALAAGAPVEIDVSKLEAGQLTRSLWQGKPVWVVNRTPEMLAALPTLDNSLRDPNSDILTQQPEYAKNATRSRKPEYVVLIGICTHLGCSPTFRPEVAPADLGAEWKGGWLCACHGSRFDLAGRVYKNVPAATNLVVPKHYYKTDSVILVGLDGDKA